MTDNQTSSPMSEATALAYNQALIEDIGKRQALLSLQAYELSTHSNTSLSQIMDEVGEKAEARGLTPEILENLLRGE